jgi:hypothetical protein
MCPMRHSKFRLAQATFKLLTVFKNNRHAHVNIALHSLYAN